LRLLYLIFFLSSLLLQNFEIQSSVQNLQSAHYIRAVLYPEDKNCCIPFCRTYYSSGRQYLSKRQIYIRLTVKCSFYTVFIFFFLQFFCSSTSLIFLHLKGLLHTLNAIVSPTKEDLCFKLSFYVLFCFAKGLAKCKFDGI
jgi:hypothetical protein